MPASFPILGQTFPAGIRVPAPPRSPQTDQKTDRRPAARRPVAVALKYELGTQSLPRIVATGKGTVAEQILELAFAWLLGHPSLATRLRRDPVMTIRSLPAAAPSGASGLPAPAADTLTPACATFVWPTSAAVSPAVG